jgi:hypothetical protein
MLQIGEHNQGDGKHNWISHNSQLKTQAGLKHKQGCTNTKKIV